MQHKQDLVGLTLLIQDGVMPVPVYQDDNGLQTFPTDEPYVMQDGITYRSPVSVIDAGGPTWVDEFGNQIMSMPVTVVPGNFVTWDANTPWDNDTLWS